jgi:hypothetical protein
LLSQSGGNKNLRDDLGRNLLQIALEDAKPDAKMSIETLKDQLAEMTLMLLCGLKLQLSETELDKAKQTCRLKGYSRALEAIEAVTETGKGQTEV